MQRAMIQDNGDSFVDATIINSSFYTTDPKNSVFNFSPFAQNCLKPNTNVEKRRFDDIPDHSISQKKYISESTMFDHFSQMNITNCFTPSVDPLLDEVDDEFVDIDNVNCQEDLCGEGSTFHISPDLRKHLRSYIVNPAKTMIDDNLYLPNPCMAIVPFTPHPLDNFMPVLTSDNKNKNNEEEGNTSNNQSPICPSRCTELMDEDIVL